jgi:predicted phosphodiesterase
LGKINYEVSKNKEKGQRYNRFDFLKDITYQDIDDRIGIVSDTHFGSYFAEPQKLRSFYDRAHEMGVRQIFHAGDITDGTDVYRDQKSDLRLVGFDAQAKEVIKNYPRRKEIETFVIMGNHDALYKERKHGRDLMEEVSSERKDLKYVGTYFARLLDESDGLTLDILHPSTNYGGLSFTIQQYLHEVPKDRLPNILIRGHKHRGSYGRYEGVHAFDAGCFIRPSEYHLNNGYFMDIGGWVADIDRTDGKFNIKVEWLDYNSS